MDLVVGLDLPTAASKVKDDLSIPENVRRQLQGTSCLEEKKGEWLPTCWRYSGRRKRTWRRGGRRRQNHWVHLKVKHYFIEKYVFEHPRLLMCNVVCKSFPFKRIRWRSGRDWAAVWLSTTDCSRGRENSMETIGLKNMATASKQSWTESQCIEKTAWRTSASSKIWNYFVYRSRQDGHPTRAVERSWTGWFKKKFGLSNRFCVAVVWKQRH